MLSVSIVPKLSASVSVNQRLNSHPCKSEKSVLSVSIVPLSQDWKGVLKRMLGLLLVVYLGIILMELPGLLRQKKYREVLVFSVFMAVGIAFTLYQHFSS